MKNIGLQVNNYKKKLEVINKELQIMPDGHLAESRGFYYHAINKKRIGITKNPDFIRLLCRKKFLLAYKKQLENNLSKPISKFDYTSPIEMICTFPGFYQKLPIDYFYHPSIKDWLENPPYRENTYKLEEKTYTSNSGKEFRSKSEVMIANSLEERNIPYHSDVEIVKWPGEQIYTDFIIKKPFTGEIILLEHFGMLHEPSYAKRMDKKMNIYLKKGYIPFETIIYTYEADMRNIQWLKDLIDSFII